MKVISYFIPLCVLVALILTNDRFSVTALFAGKENNASTFITDLTDSCHQHWLKHRWIIHGQLAQSNQAFSNGIRNVCQARAELFFEGYEISPFIASDEQKSVFPLVLINSVEQIKSQLKTHIPQLRII